MCIIRRGYSTKQETTNYLVCKDASILNVSGPVAIDLPGVVAFVTDDIYTDGKLTDVGYYTERLDFYGPFPTQYNVTVDPPSHGTAVVITNNSKPQIYYTPSTSNLTADVITYKAILYSGGPLGDSSTQFLPWPTMSCSCKIYINDKETPSCVDFWANTQENAKYIPIELRGRISFLSNDYIIQLGSTSEVNNNNRVFLRDTELMYTPNKNFIGTELVTYIITKPDNSFSITCNCKVTVSGTTPAPTSTPTPTSTSTPAPTKTPAPTYTPRPTTTPKPITTPIWPTSTPTQTPTPTPTVYVTPTPAGFLKCGYQYVTHFTPSTDMVVHRHWLDDDTGTITIRANFGEATGRMVITHGNGLNGGLIDTLLDKTGLTGDVELTFNWDPPNLSPDITLPIEYVTTETIITGPSPVCGQDDPIGIWPALQAPDPEDVDITDVTPYSQICNVDSSPLSGYETPYGIWVSADGTTPYDIGTDSFRLYAFITTSAYGDWQIMALGCKQYDLYVNHKLILRGDAYWQQRRTMHLPKGISFIEINGLGGSDAFELIIFDDKDNLYAHTRTTDFIHVLTQKCDMGFVFDYTLEKCAWPTTAAIVDDSFNENKVAWYFEVPNTTDYTFSLRTKNYGAVYYDGNKVLETDRDSLLDDSKLPYPAQYGGLQIARTSIEMEKGPHSILVHMQRTHDIVGTYPYLLMAKYGSGGCIGCFNQTWTGASDNPWEYIVHEVGIYPYIWVHQNGSYFSTKDPIFFEAILEIPRSGTYQYSVSYATTFDDTVNIYNVATGDGTLQFEQGNIRLTATVANSEYYGFAIRDWAGNVIYSSRSGFLHAPGSDKSCYLSANLSTGKWLTDIDEKLPLRPTPYDTVVPVTSSTWNAFMNNNAIWGAWDTNDGKITNTFNGPERLIFDIDVDLTGSTDSPLVLSASCDDKATFFIKNTDNKLIPVIYAEYWTHIYYLHITMEIKGFAVVCQNLPCGYDWATNPGGLAMVVMGQKTTPVRIPLAKYDVGKVYSTWSSFMSGAIWTTSDGTTPWKGADPDCVIIDTNLHIPEAGDYEFYVGIDDEVNFYIDGKLEFTVTGSFGLAIPPKNTVLSLAQGAHHLEISFKNVSPGWSDTAPINPAGLKFQIAGPVGKASYNMIYETGSTNNGVIDNEGSMWEGTWPLTYKTQDHISYNQVYATRDGTAKIRSTKPPVRSSEDPTTTCSCVWPDYMELTPFAGYQQIPWNSNTKPLVINNATELYYKCGDNDYRPWYGMFALQVDGLMNTRNMAKCLHRVYRTLIDCCGLMWDRPQMNDLKVGISLDVTSGYLIKVIGFGWVQGMDEQSTINNFAKFMVTLSSTIDDNQKAAAITYISSAGVNLVDEIAGLCSVINQDSGATPQSCDCNVDSAYTPVTSSPYPYSHRVMNEIYQAMTNEIPIMDMDAISDLIAKVPPLYFRTEINSGCGSFVAPCGMANHSSETDPNKDPTPWGGYPLDGKYALLSDGDWNENDKGAWNYGSTDGELYIQAWGAGGRGAGGGGGGGSYSAVKVSGSVITQKTFYYCVPAGGSEQSGYVMSYDVPSLDLKFYSAHNANRNIHGVGAIKGTGGDINLPGYDGSDGPSGMGGDPGGVLDGFGASGCNYMFVYDSLECISWDDDGNCSGYGCVFPGKGNCDSGDNKNDQCSSGQSICRHCNDGGSPGGGGAGADNADCCPGNGGAGRIIFSGLAYFDIWPVLAQYTIDVRAGQKVAEYMLNSVLDEPYLYENGRYDAFGTRARYIPLITKLKLSMYGILNTIQSMWDVFAQNWKLSDNVVANCDQPAQIMVTLVAVMQRNEMDVECLSTFPYGYSLYLGYADGSVPPMITSSKVQPLLCTWLRHLLKNFFIVPKSITVDIKDDCDIMKTIATLLKTEDPTTKSVDWVNPIGTFSLSITDPILAAQSKDPVIWHSRLPNLRRFYCHPLYIPVDKHTVTTSLPPHIDVFNTHDDASGENMPNDNLASCICEADQIHYPILINNLIKGMKILSWNGGTGSKSGSFTVDGSIISSDESQSTADITHDYGNLYQIITVINLTLQCSANISTSVDHTVDMTTDRANGIHVKLYDSGNTYVDVTSADPTTCMCNIMNALCQLYYSGFRSISQTEIDRVAALQIPYKLAHELDNILAGEIEENLPTVTCEPYKDYQQHTLSGYELWTSPCPSLVWNSIYNVPSRVLCHNGVPLSPADLEGKLFFTQCCGWQPWRASVYLYLNSDLIGCSISLAQHFIEYGAYEGVRQNRCWYAPNITSSVLIPDQCLSWLMDLYIDVSIGCSTIGNTDKIHYMVSCPNQEDTPTILFDQYKFPNSQPVESVDSDAIKYTGASYDVPYGGKQQTMFPICSPSNTVSVDPAPTFGPVTEKAPLLDESFTWARVFGSGNYSATYDFGGWDGLITVKFDFTNNPFGQMRVWQGDGNSAILIADSNFQDVRQGTELKTLRYEFHQIEYKYMICPGSAARCTGPTHVGERGGWPYYIGGRNCPYNSIVNVTNTAWPSFMNDNAVWVSDGGKDPYFMTGDVNFIGRMLIPKNDTYTIQAAADDNATFYIGQNQALTVSGATPVSQSVTLNGGENVLKITVTNVDNGTTTWSDNPAAVAFSITDSTGYELYNSRSTHFLYLARCQTNAQPDPGCNIIEVEVIGGKGDGKPQDGGVGTDSWEYAIKFEAAYVEYPMFKPDNCLKTETQSQTPSLTIKTKANITTSNTEKQNKHQHSLTTIVGDRDDWLHVDKMYETNDIEIWARTNAVEAGPNGDNGNVISFDLVLNDKHTNPYYDVVTGHTSADIYYYKATTFLGIKNPSIQVDSDFSAKALIIVTPEIIFEATRGKCQDNITTVINESPQDDPAYIYVIPVSSPIWNTKVNEYMVWVSVDNNEPYGVWDKPVSIIGTFNVDVAGTYILHCAVDHTATFNRNGKTIFTSTMVGVWESKKIGLNAGPNTIEVIVQKNSGGQTFSLWENSPIGVAFYIISAHGEPLVDSRTYNQWYVEMRCRSGLDPDYISRTCKGIENQSNTIEEEYWHNEMHIAATQPIVFRWKIKNAHRVDTFIRFESGNCEFHNLNSNDDPWIKIKNMVDTYGPVILGDNSYIGCVLSYNVIAYNFITQTQATEKIILHFDQRGCYCPTNMINLCHGYCYGKSWVDASQTFNFTAIVSQVLANNSYDYNPFAVWVSTGTGTSIDPAESYDQWVGIVRELNLNPGSYHFKLAGYTEALCKINGQEILHATSEDWVEKTIELANEPYLMEVFGYRETNGIDWSNMPGRFGCVIYDVAGAQVWSSIDNTSAPLPYLCPAGSFTDLSQCKDGKCIQFLYEACHHTPCNCPPLYVPDKWECVGRTWTDPVVTYTHRFVAITHPNPFGVWPSISGARADFTQNRWMSVGWTLDVKRTGTFQFVCESNVSFQLRVNNNIVTNFENSKTTNNIDLSGESMAIMTYCHIPLNVETVQESYFWAYLTNPAGNVVWDTRHGHPVAFACPPGFDQDLTRNKCSIKQVIACGAQPCNSGYYYDQSSGNCVPIQTYVLEVPSVDNEVVTQETITECQIVARKKKTPDGTLPPFLSCVSKQYKRCAITSGGNFWTAGWTAVTTAEYTMQCVGFYVGDGACSVIITLDNPGLDTWTRHEEECGPCHDSSSPPAPTPTTPGGHKLKPGGGGGGGMGGPTGTFAQPGDVKPDNSTAGGGTAGGTGGGPGSEGGGGGGGGGPGMVWPDLGGGGGGGEPVSYPSGGESMQSYGDSTSGGGYTNYGCTYYWGLPNQDPSLPAAPAELGGPVDAPGGGESIVDPFPENDPMFVLEKNIKDISPMPRTNFDTTGMFILHRNLNDVDITNLPGSDPFNAILCDYDDPSYFFEENNSDVIRKKHIVVDSRREIASRLEKPQTAPNKAKQDDDIIEDDAGNFFENGEREIEDHVLNLDSDDPYRFFDEIDSEKPKSFDRAAAPKIAEPAGCDCTKCDITEYNDKTWVEIEYSVVYCGNVVYTYTPSQSDFVGKKTMKCCSGAPVPPTSKTGITPPDKVNGCHPPQLGHFVKHKVVFCKPAVTATSGSPYVFVFAKVKFYDPPMDITHDSHCETFCWTDPPTCIAHVHHHPHGGGSPANPGSGGCGNTGPAGSAPPSDSAPPADSAPPSDSAPAGSSIYDPFPDSDPSLPIQRYDRSHRTFSIYDPSPGEGDDLRDETDMTAYQFGLTTSSETGIDRDFSSEEFFDTADLEDAGHHWAGGFGIHGRGCEPPGPGPSPTGGPGNGCGPTAPTTPSTAPPSTGPGPTGPAGESIYDPFPDRDLALDSIPFRQSYDGSIGGDLYDPYPGEGDDLRRENDSTSYGGFETGSETGIDRDFSDEFFHESDFEIAGHQWAPGFGIHDRDCSGPPSTGTPSSPPSTPSTPSTPPSTPAEPPPEEPVTPPETPPEEPPPAPAQPELQPQPAPPEPPVQQQFTTYPSCPNTYYGLPGQDPGLNNAAGNYFAKPGEAGYTPDPGTGQPGQVWQQGEHYVGSNGQPTGGTSPGHYVSARDFAMDPNDPYWVVDETAEAPVRLFRNVIRYVKADNGSEPDHNDPMGFARASLKVAKRADNQTRVGQATWFSPAERDLDRASGAPPDNGDTTTYTVIPGKTHCMCQVESLDRTWQAPPTRSGGASYQIWRCYGGTKYQQSPSHQSKAGAYPKKLDRANFKSRNACKDLSLGTFVDPGYTIGKFNVHDNTEWDGVLPVDPNKATGPSSKHGGIPWFTPPHTFLKLLSVDQQRDIIQDAAPVYRDISSDKVCPQGYEYNALTDNCEYMFGIPSHDISNCGVYINNEQNISRGWTLVDEGKKHPFIGVPVAALYYNGRKATPNDVEGQMFNSSIGWVIFDSMVYANLNVDVYEECNSMQHFIEFGAWESAYLNRCFSDKVINLSVNCFKFEDNGMNRSMGWIISDRLFYKGKQATLQDLLNGIFYYKGQWKKINIESCYDSLINIKDLPKDLFALGEYIIENISLLKDVCIAYDDGLTAYPEFILPRYLDCDINRKNGWFLKTVGHNNVLHKLNKIATPHDIENERFYTTEGFVKFNLENYKSMTVNADIAQLLNEGVKIDEHKSITNMAEHFIYSGASLGIPMKIMYSDNVYFSKYIDCVSNIKNGWTLKQIGQNPGKLLFYKDKLATKRDLEKAELFTSKGAFEVFDVNEYMWINGFRNEDEAILHFITKGAYQGNWGRAFKVMPRQG